MSLLAQIEAGPLGKYAAEFPGPDYQPDWPEEKCFTTVGLRVNNLKLTLTYYDYMADPAVWLNGTSHLVIRGIDSEHLLKKAGEVGRLLLQLLALDPRESRYDDAVERLHELSSS